MEKKTKRKKHLKDYVRKLKKKERPVEVAKEPKASLSSEEMPTPLQIKPISIHKPTPKKG